MKIDNLEVIIAPSRLEVGQLAAKHFEEETAKFGQRILRAMFASAPSQNEFLASLLENDQLPWERIEVFHMDEYVNMDYNHPKSFSNFLVDSLFSKRPFAKVNLIDGTLTPEEVCSQYGQLLAEAPLDIIALGIGENGHLAFNDPPAADFNDKQVVKFVELEEKCRIQQWHDACFSSLNEVPKVAYTATIPTLMNAATLVCIVPGRNKAEAVRDTLHGEITERCPASILRRHPNATLFLDRDSASLLNL